ncbi:MAG: hypothetical protein NC111_04210 [Bacteroides sp.]|nr:hypothetical protein [Bacteroides sp.]MCM1413008.1 hypothetical protein [Bacteroides sp.]MCM1471714.1 hypothetical protein [Bacteroides sp.]
MDIQNILGELTSKFGNSFDVTKVTEHLKGIDTSKFSMTEIIEKVKGAGLIGDLDGDGVKESVFEEIKGKIGNMFGGK